MSSARRPSGSPQFPPRRWTPAPAADHAAIHPGGRTPGALEKRPSRKLPSRGATLRPSSPQTAAPACGAAVRSRLRSIRCLQAEPHAADRLDQLVAGRLAELSPEVADMHVHHVALGIEVHVPHFFQQFRAAHYFLRMQQEMLQQVEFLGREIKTLAVDASLVLQPIELHRAVLQYLRAAGAPAPHQRAYAGEQLVGLARLGEMLAGTRGESADHIL